MSALQVYYRISDTPAYRVKQKARGVSNENCLNNFIKNFGPARMHIVADAVNADTRALLVETALRHGFETTFLQNKSGSLTFGHVLDLALLHDDDDILYLVEDDFLHLPGSKKLLLEAFRETAADYVTLYDHPDKYIDKKEGGPNPFVKNGGEKTRVIITSSAHWKTTNSTVLTFAARARTLREDETQWRRCIRGKVPDDFRAFSRLCKARAFYRPFKRKRVLIHPIPARATHGEREFLAPFTDWEAVAALKDQDSG
ncbi:MAG: hypothetical protein JXQ30_01595 [Spirochaetes bacterium]|nr:hypothetical protein [Spirochaetota bacterium]